MYQQRLYCSGSAGAAPHLWFQASACTKHCVLHQWQLLRGWKCSLLACAVLDDEIAALLPFHLRGAACGALESSPGPVGGSDTQLNCKADKRREIFLGTQQGLNGVDTIKMSLKVPGLGYGCDFLFNAQKPVFSPSYLWLFQSQWCCCASREYLPSTWASDTERK